MACSGPLELTDRTLLPTRVSLGEPLTPLVAVSWPPLEPFLKLEAALPTGSFKDRGSSFLAAWLAEHGAERAVIDSSGNAGASVAAYCAAAGIACEVYAPADASAAKLTQIEVYGARVVRVPGPRAAAGEAARAAAAAADGAVYASHAWSPLFLAGTQSFAFELWAELGRAPHAVVMPVGAGTLFLGVVRGFAALRAAGEVDAVPRLYGAQAAACPPLARAFAAGAVDPVQVEPLPSAAEGVLTAAPPRGREILAAARETGGGIVEIGEEEIWTTVARLGRLGLYVEPTAALGPAALEQLATAGAIEPGEIVAVALTGSGLKAGALIRDRLFPG